MSVPPCLRTWRWLGAAALALFALVLVPLASAQRPSWEMRVCADPDALPFSHRDGTGFENRIAAILAETLNARLTYDWSVFTEDLVNLRFAEGECDVIMGVPDGFEKSLTTIAYYQSPYVMVFRADAGFTLDSLDDDALSNLRIGVQGQGSPPHQALQRRGLLLNVTNVYGGEVGQDHLAVLVRAVEEGEIDVGFGWGPTVGPFAEASSVDLVVKPVQPEFDFPGIFQMVPMTIGVRRNDTALRDLLDRAIAARWDDIQRVLQEYDIPTTPLPTPLLAERPTTTGVLPIGVILPYPTGGRTRVAAINDIVGEAARMGALQAEGAVNAVADETGFDVALHMASAPSAAAARRAADRLLNVDGVHALVGGLGAGQAEVLAEAAEARGVAFLNVGSNDLTLRERCFATTLHLEPSAGTYLDAMVRWYRPVGAASPDASQRWFVVGEDSAEGLARAERARLAAEAVGDVVVGSSAVPPGRPTYFDVLDDVVASGADAVLLLLDPADQLAFQGQALDAGMTLRVAPFPDPVTQTRDYLASSARYGVGLDVPRIVLWETTLTDGDANDLNERFTSRWGQPMDPTAWSTYQAIRMLHQAVVATSSLGSEAILAYLTAPDTRFDTGKGPGVSFREASHELRQPLYVVAIDPSATWGVTLSAKVAAARLVGRLPTEDTTTLADDAAVRALDALGGMAEPPRCGSARSSPPPRP